MKKIVVSAFLALAILFGNMSPAPAFLDKTRFLAHLGVAYFVFHHWVMNPYHEGKFNNGAPHRTATIVKAGVALLFAYHEVKVSQKIAAKSKDPLLQKLNGALPALATAVAAMGAKFKSGHFDPGDVSTLDSQTNSISTTASQNGTTIKDVPVAIPGT